jgi:hypothetical protein
MSLKKLGKSGMFGLAGLAATNPKITNKIARNGGLGIMGMLAAKNKKAAPAAGMRGRPMMEDIVTAERVPANMAAPIMAGDVDAMMGRGAQRDMSGMKKGGKVKKMAKGGSTASKRADGCATKGKTKGRFV